MKKVKYHYNTESGEFEPIKETNRIILISTFFLLLLVVISGFAFNTIVDKSNEAEYMGEKLSDIQKQYQILNQEITETQKKLAELEEKDNKLYRSYFDLEPINEYGFGENKPSKNISFEESKEKLEKINNKITKESKSLDEIYLKAKKNEEKYANLPAIQPIFNKNLSQLASGFGVRLHPILKIEKFHAGVDFSAKAGTPIYATANGKITYAKYEGGYGNVVKINHGFGYETLYAHLSQIKTRVGKKIKRGEIIGLVGTTGLSTGNHLHYEVKKQGKNVNPMEYFIQDMSQEDFKKLAKNASKMNQSLD
jgi:murein DD-endopeptidase MepM/ murein hydrolase activator NlpD